MLDKQRIEKEKIQLEIIKQNSDISKRYNELKYKEFYLKNKYEYYERIKNFVYNKEK